MPTRLSQPAYRTSVSASPLWALQTDGKCGLLAGPEPVVSRDRGVRLQGVLLRDHLAPGLRDLDRDLHRLARADVEAHLTQQQALGRPPDASPRRHPDLAVGDESERADARSEGVARAPDRDVCEPVLVDPDGLALGGHAGEGDGRAER